MTTSSSSSVSLRECKSFQAKSHECQASRDPNGSRRSRLGSSMVSRQRIRQHCITSQSAPLGLIWSCQHAPIHHNSFKNTEASQMRCPDLAIMINWIGAVQPWLEQYLQAIIAVDYGMNTVWEEFVRGCVNAPSSWSGFKTWSESLQRDFLCWRKKPAKSNRWV